MTLYCIIVNIVHIFCAFSFRIRQAVRNISTINEIFAIYDIFLITLLLKHGAISASPTMRMDTS